MSEIIGLQSAIIAVKETLLMTWSTPEYIDIRFGFEVTMYVYNR